MQKVSFYDRKGTVAKKIIEFSFWKINQEFFLNNDIISDSSELQDKIIAQNTDILIAVTDGMDIFAPEKIREMVKKFSRMQLIVIGRDASYKTVRNYLINGVFDYLVYPVDETMMKDSIFRMYEDTGVDYVMNNLKLKADALIDNIFLGGGQEEFIISEIINQIYDDWNNDPVNCQLVSDRAKIYIYETLIERKPWLEKFLYKNDFTHHFGFTLKSREELILQWLMNFREASIMVTKYQMIDDKLVYRIGKYAVVHVDERLTLDDVSNGVFLNASYISHIFKKITGMNFIDFMTEVKIDRAKVLLRDPDIRINEVAHILGFSNQEYFTKNFKKKTGQTPTAFQKILLEKYSG